MIVVAAVHFALVRALLRQLDGGRAAEFAAPDDERFVEQAALLQIDEQCADRLIALLGQVAVLDFEVVVAVPRLAGAVPQLHEAHAALDQPAGDEQLPGLHAGAVHVANVLRLAANVERLGRLGLHAEAELERANAGFERRIIVPGLRVASVEPFEQVELLALLRQRDAIVANVLDQLLDLRVLRVDVRAFVDAGQESGLPVLRLLNRVAVRAHRDERRQVLVFAAQAVAEPGAEAGPNLPGVAAVHEQQRQSRGSAHRRASSG